MDTKILLVIAAAVLAVAALLIFYPTSPSEAVSTLPASTAPTAIQVPTSAGEPPVTAPEVVSVAGMAQAEVTQTPSADLSPAWPSRRVIAAYFHNTTRCVTCRAIEKLARETIESEFSAELASGRLVWRALNMEEKENEHYAIDYALTSPSLVLVEMDGDREVRFKVLNETWTLIHSELRFVVYIEDAVRTFLEEV